MSEHDLDSSEVSQVGQPSGGVSDGIALPVTVATILGGAALLSSCGDGSGSGTGATAAPSVGAGSASVDTPAYLFKVPANRDEAARFLMQSTFGAPDADVDRVMALGYSGWIDEQLDPTTTPQVPLLNYINTFGNGTDPEKPTTNIWNFGEAFYQNAIAGKTPLRDRLAFELTKFFVLSTLPFLIGRSVAPYYDVLAKYGTTTYRQLLEAVTLNPAMGQYLSMVSNQKENDQGRIPDQNYAREVQQLFSIGLFKLNMDGTPQLDSSGAQIPTFTQDDVVGFSRVFTGYSYAGPDQSNTRFFGFAKDNPDQMTVPMVFYPNYHSTAAKSFLGVSLPAGGGAEELGKALDALASHPNVPPFFGRQLIQRFVTSNPSKAYVQRVAQAFVSSTGDMKAVLKAVLLDDEARDPANMTKVDFGKPREPLIRLLALLRGFGATSTSGKYRMQITDDAATSWGQTPMRAPSVFNYYQPDFAPPLTRVAGQSLVAPEMQMMHEVSIVGFPNQLEMCLNIGFGFYEGARPDIRLTFHDNATAAEFASNDLRALADTPADLVARISHRLFNGQMGATLTSQIVGAVTGITLPAAKADGSNGDFIDFLRKQRIKTAVYLAMLSPQFLVQR